MDENFYMAKNVHSNSWMGWCMWTFFYWFVEIDFSVGWVNNVFLTFFNVHPFCPGKVPVTGTSMFKYRTYFVLPMSCCIHPLQ